MRKRLLHLGVVPVLVVGLMLPAALATADPATTTISPVMALDANGKPVGDSLGFSRLVREDTGLSYELTTSGLTPLNVYTVWWVLFLPNKQTEFLSMIGGGAVALPNGMASFAGRLPVGAIPNVDGRTVMVATSKVFDNPRGVRVLLVLRDHGPIILEHLAKMLTTFNAGCPPNECKDVQASVHAP